MGTNNFERFTVRSGSTSTLAQDAVAYLRRYGMENIPGPLIEPIAWLMDAVEHPQSEAERQAATTQREAR